MQSMKSVDLIGHLSFCHGVNSTVAAWPDPPSEKLVAYETRWSCPMLIDSVPCQASHISWLHHNGMGSPPLWWRSTCSGAPSVSTFCNLWDGGKRGALMTWWVAHVRHMFAHVYAWDTGHAPMRVAPALPHASKIIQNHPLIWHHKEYVVTFIMPVEVFATKIKILDWQKCAWLLPSEVLDYLIYNRSKVKLLPCMFYLLFRRLPWSLDWFLRKALITWFNFDSDHKHFYTALVTTSCIISRFSSYSRPACTPLQFYVFFSFSAATLLPVSWAGPPVHSLHWQPFNH